MKTTPFLVFLEFLAWMDLYSGAVHIPAARRAQGGSILGNR
jgi:hypothetical protein